MQEFHFPTWVNKFTALAAITALTVGGYLATCLFAAIHPSIVNVGHQPKQPVPFSHKLHAGKLKMDCRYCHNTVEKAGHAAVPPTATCGNCHGGNRTAADGRTLGVIHAENTLLEPIRKSLVSKEPVPWQRVHDLPDFVYFNHSAHINKGVSCVSCHGRVDQMEVVTQVESLSMKWCLDCHRKNTETGQLPVRDPNLVTQLDLEIENPNEYHAEWAEKLEVNPKINCSTCHR